MKTCYFCKSPVIDARVRAIRQHKGKLYVIDEVPAQVCEACGQEFYRGWVLEEMDRLIEQGDDVQEKLTVPVMRFSRELVA